LVARHFFCICLSCLNYLHPGSLQSLAPKGGQKLEHNEVDGRGQLMVISARRPHHQRCNLEPGGAVKSYTLTPFGHIVICRLCCVVRKDVLPVSTCICTAIFSPKEQSSRICFTSSGNAVLGISFGMVYSCTGNDSVTPILSSASEQRPPIAGNYPLACTAVVDAKTTRREGHFH
jgi:hypothetical protein